MMDSTVMASIISTAGVIIAAYLNYYLSKSNQQKTMAALATAKSDADKLTSAAYISQLSSAATIQTNASTPLDATRPFDTAISCNKTADALIFMVPPNFKYVFRLLAAIGFLVAWTAGLFAASLSFAAIFYDLTHGGQSVDWFALLFLFGWLIGAVAAEYTIIKSAVGTMYRALGEQFLIYNSELLIHISRLSFFNEKAGYIYRNVQNMSGTEAGLHFDYGKRKITIPGVTENEANWIKRSIEQFKPAYGAPV